MPTENYKSLLKENLTYLNILKDILCSSIGRLNFIMMAGSIPQIDLYIHFNPCQTPRKHFLFFCRNWQADPHPTSKTVPKI